MSAYMYIKILRGEGTQLNFYNMRDNNYLLYYTCISNCFFFVVVVVYDLPSLWRTPTLSYSRLLTKPRKMDACFLQQMAKQLSLALLKVGQLRCVYM